MASERQIAANRRNARKSTGPRSRAGKKRARGNAFRHGLSRGTAGTAFAKELEDLARKIAGDTEGDIAFKCARTAAAAELEIARVRVTKVALIARLRALGTLDLPEQEPARTAEAFRRALPELLRLDRYERRAASRRDQALLHLRCMSS
jgi:hypothetical protein